MGLQFDAKTGVLTGELDFISDEEDNRTAELVRKGHMMSTKHSNESIPDEIIEWQKKQFEAARKRRQEANS